jgi:hypothetical protein
MVSIHSHGNGFPNINSFVLVAQNPTISKQAAINAFQDIAGAKELPTLSPRFGLNNSQHDVADVMQYFKAVLDSAEQPKD